MMSNCDKCKDRSFSLRTVNNNTRISFYALILAGLIETTESHFRTNSKILVLHQSIAWTYYNCVLIAFLELPWTLYFIWDSNSTFHCTVPKDLCYSDPAKVEHQWAWWAHGSVAFNKIHTCLILISAPFFTWKLWIRFQFIFNIVTGRKKCQEQLQELPL